MDVEDASNVTVLERFPSLPLDLPEDIDVTSSTWSDCMFTSTDDEVLEASDIFSLEELDTIPLTSLSSSCSRTTAPSSPVAPSSPSAPETERGQIALNIDPSCSPRTPSPNVEESAWVKSEQIDLLSEHLDCASTTHGQTLDSNDSVVNIFGDDINSVQQQEQMGDFWYLQEQALGDPGLPPSLTSLSSSDSQESAPSIGSWPQLPSELSEEEHSENFPQVFAQWMRRNAECFSPSDLKKIKLKTSTIENATKRLGGGKKGMVYLLKLILIWIQDHHLQRRSGQASAMELRTGGPDVRHTDSPCTPSSIDNRVTEGDNLLLHGFLDDACKEAGSSIASMKNGRDLRGMLIACEGQGVGGLVNPMVVQQISEAGLGVDHVYANQLCPLSLAPVNPSLYSRNSANLGQISSDDLGDMSSFTVKHSQNSPSPANLSHLSLHLDHAALPSSFPVLAQHLSDNRQWHGSMTEMNAMGGATLQERVLQSFAVTRLSMERSPYMAAGDSVNLRTSSPAATTRAARKNRMARQRWSARHARMWPSSTNQLSWSHQLSSASLKNMPYNSQACNRLSTSIGEVRQGRRSEKNLRLLLQKELKQSDVGNLGRIVLPKKEAETNLPYLSLRDGINLIVEDMSTSKVWNMRYRYWPNNKSRMYLLENTGDFVKSQHLKEGDYMMLYAGTAAGRYMIRGVRVQKSDTSRSAAEKSSSSSTHSDVEGAIKAHKANSGVTNLVRTTVSDNIKCSLDIAERVRSPKNGNISDDSISEAFESDCLFNELIDKLPDDPKDALKLERFPSLQTCDLPTDDDISV